MFKFFNFKKQDFKMPITTDIHCHVVPGVDDGSPDADTSVELLERMSSWGFKRIFASPHVTEATFENTPDILDPAMEELREAVARKGLPIELERHAEYRIDDFFRSQLSAGLITTLPGKYILIENSFLMEPLGLPELTFDLKLKGYMPILAHPERYSYYAGSRGRYEELHAAGLLFQVNLLSLAGHYGNTERETAEKLISHGLVDFVGTDLHNHRHADSLEAYLGSNRAAKHFKAMDYRLLNDKI